MKPIYVLGTGLSHNGSAVLLKDGKICVAIEKERVTRQKHDGGNDSAAISYCLEAEKITLDDIDLVVQCANFEIPSRERFHGERLFAATETPRLESISHHLAHAYSSAGTCSFDECVIMVIDGCGSPLDQCTETFDPAVFHFSESDRNKMICEKDSFYYFDGQKMKPLFKDFSPMAVKKGTALDLQTTQHSIGGFYAAISHYVFGNLDDVGKLMGLAPYGKKSNLSETSAFEFREKRLFVKEEWKLLLTKPAKNYQEFKADFHYYADVAFWAQNQVENAVKDCFRHRISQFEHSKVAYSGGVALNAVANNQLIEEAIVKELYMEPAAGDNGLALGCAFYGWLEILGRKRVPHDGNACFGKVYNDEEIQNAVEEIKTLYTVTKVDRNFLQQKVAEYLADGKIVAWFNGGSEFGPRALGHRSILAHPGIDGLADKINAEVKFREDFRPFAPAILAEKSTLYFESGRESPYMILVDHTKQEFLQSLKNVTHVNGTARVQTVSKKWNADFHDLLTAFYEKTNIPVLLNTSFNKKGMPMIETPEQAISLFGESAIDILVIEDYLIVK